MGRANLPTRRARARDVQPGDVVLIRSPEVLNTRWFLVDWVNPVVPGVAWSGRWAFGKDAGHRTVVRVAASHYTVKDERDARRDRARLELLRERALHAGTHV